MGRPASEKVCEWRPDLDVIKSCRMIQLENEQDHSRDRILGNVSRERELRSTMHWSLCFVMADVTRSTTLSSCLDFHTTMD